MYSHAHAVFSYQKIRNNNASDWFEREVCYADGPGNIQSFFAGVEGRVGGEDWPFYGGRLLKLTKDGLAKRHNRSCNDHLSVITSRLYPLSPPVPTCSPSRGGRVAVCFFDIKPTELAHSFLFCSCVCFCLYGPFDCISFHKFSQQLPAFSLCSFGLISALLVLSTMYLFLNVYFSPKIILCG